MNDEAYMRLAIEKALQGVAAGQSPFGAVIMQDGNLIAGEHNSVWRDLDPTAHAEVNAIRRAAHQLRTIRLNGCVMYTTCEPCPMCLSSIHWAKIDRVVYGASIADATAAGFSELLVPARELARLGKSPLVVEDGVLAEECKRLFEVWRTSGQAKAY
jgi:guanine deaminase